MYVAIIVKTLLRAAEEKTNKSRRRHIRKPKSCVGQENTLYVILLQDVAFVTKFTAHRKKKPQQIIEDVIFWDFRHKICSLENNDKSSYALRRLKKSPKNKRG